MTALFEQGLMLMLMGMGIVFVFLTVLVLVVKLMTRVLSPYAVAGAPQHESEEHEREVAAISAALDYHQRQKHNKGK